MRRPHERHSLALLSELALSHQGFEEMFRDSVNWAAFREALAVVLEPERGERKELISSNDESVTDAQAPGTALWSGEGGY